MKTLNEEIQEIKNMKGSKAVKKEAFIKLGLRKYEIELLLSELPKPVREVHKFTFGVEIECLVAASLMRESAMRNEMPFQYEGYNHVDNNHYYKFVSDSSIRGENPIECVSPVLTGKAGMKSLENCCKALNEAGAQVNISTGLHVHIGAANLSDEAYINVFKNYQKLERVIDTFMARSRRANNSQWCRTLQGRNFMWCTTKSDIFDAMNGDRYFKVNACSYARHKTIEFRQHQGSTDFEKISNWVNFCAKLVAWSKKNVLSSEVTSIDEIPFLTKKEKSFFKSRAEVLA
ncbi:amidoligase family protein [Bacteroides ndongoniae]|jgi:hypothetical protein|uniref:amidoligase family protein n=1 Tax=Bacteroides ndongoniae TaxID=1903262 RepID=UPI0023F72D61|nr:amidoligase family protein [Bacteroides ndongoniae]